MQFYLSGICNAGKLSYLALRKRCYAKDVTQKMLRKRWNTTLLANRHNCYSDTYYEKTRQPFCFIRICW